MTNLELLIELQAYDYEIARLEEELKDLGEEVDIKTIEGELNLLEKTRLRLLEDRERLSKESNLLNRELKDNYFNIEDRESKLYDGTIKDLQQLDQMNEENIELKRETEKKEDELLIIMEKDEIIKKELEKLDRSLWSLEENLNKKKSSHNKLIARERERLDSILDKKRETVERLDEDYLDEYKKLSKTRLDFIAQLKEERCMGCNMILPVYIRDRVGEQELVHCENCNRLLYKKD